MKKLIYLILFVLNLVLVQAQEIKLVSVNGALQNTTLPDSITISKEIHFKNFYKYYSPDSTRPDTLTTPYKWMVKLTKKLTRKERKDNNIYIFFVPLADSATGGFLPITGKYGYIYVDTTKKGAYWLENQLKKVLTHKHQWDNIHDPAFHLGWFDQESEGAMMATFDCKNYTQSELESYYPKTWFTNIPCNLQSLVSYIETNKLWNGQDIDKNIKLVKDKLLKDYFIRYDSKESAYLFDYEAWKTKKVNPTGDIKTLQDLKIKDEITSKFLCSYWDDLFFESSRQKKCDTYNETSSTASKKGFVNQLCSHFTGTCYLADGTQFKWKDGSYKYFPDPRMYYNTTTGNYDLEKLKTDLRLFINTKYASMVGINAENSNLLQYHQEQWLSMYAEYMCERGYAEVDGASSGKQQTIKQDFYNLWGKSGQWGYYWQWHSLNTERLEKERQAYIAKLQGEASLQQYLTEIQNGKIGAIAEITLGSLEVVGTVAIVILYPPVGVAEISLTAASGGFAIDQIAGGIRTLNAINNGLFDPNKEYKFVKGLLIDNFGENYGKIYDFSSILAGAVSVRGDIVRIKTIRGDELEKILKAYSAGSGTVNTGYDTYQLITGEKK
jgi:hypothetical protein